MNMNLMITAAMATKTMIPTTRLPTNRAIKVKLDSDGGVCTFLLSISEKETNHFNQYNVKVVNNTKKYKYSNVIDIIIERDFPQGISWCLRLR